MNTKVFYHSSTGNTKKLAEAIAESLSVSAQPIEKGKGAGSAPVDLLFIGDGIYFGKPHGDTDAFIESLDPETVKNVAVFASYGGQEKIGAELKKSLEDRGLHVLGAPFLCKGQSWALANRGRPNEEDIAAARAFAKDIASQVE